MKMALDPWMNKRQEWRKLMIFDRWKLHYNCPQITAHHSYNLCGIYFTCFEDEMATGWPFHGYYDSYFEWGGRQRGKMRKGSLFATLHICRRGSVIEQPRMVSLTDLGGKNQKGNARSRRDRFKGKRKSACLVRKSPLSISILFLSIHSYIPISDPSSTSLSFWLSEVTSRKGVTCAFGFMQFALYSWIQCALYVFLLSFIKFSFTGKWRSVWVEQKERKEGRRKGKWILVNKVRRRERVVKLSMTDVSRFELLIWTKTDPRKMLANFLGEFKIATNQRWDYPASNFRRREMSTGTWTRKIFPWLECPYNDISPSFLTLHQPKDSFLIQTCKHYCYTVKLQPLADHLLPSYLFISMNIYEP